MIRKWKLVIGIFIFVQQLYGATEQSFIILTTAETKEQLEQHISRYEKVLKQNTILQTIQHQDNFKTAIFSIYNIEAVKVGPFENVNTLSLAYIELRRDFPQAFILEDVSYIKDQPVRVKYKEIIVEKEDQTLWIALFGLGIIGILSMFLSSDQIKNLREKHNQILDKQNEIEKKQSLLLEKMGEKIQTVALRNVDNEVELLEMPLEEIDKKEIKTRIEKLKKYDEDLLRTTYEMIDFLKIKSGNIVIKQEAFQLSNMLHKLTNAVVHSLKNKEHVLTYDIKSVVTRYLIGDTVRIYQILHNLLADILDHDKASEVTLSIDVKEEENLVFTLSNSQLYLTPEEIDTLFIPSSWEEVQGTHKEFGFFVIKELIENMNGRFLVESDKKRGTCYVLTLPYIRDIDNKSHRKELIKVLSSKKALVIDTHIKKSEILTEILHSFDIEVLFKTSKNLETYRPKLDGLDFIIIKSEDISKKVFDFLKNIDKKEDIDIIVIDDIFEEDKSVEAISYIADAVLYSPLIVGDVEEILKQLCIKKARRKQDLRQDGIKDFKILDVAKVSMADFQKFRDKTILIVEDNFVSQQVMSSILGASKLNILKAENGKEALAILEENIRVDLIFMDMNMPIMDGFETSKKIRKNNKYKKVPIVAVTGLGFNYEVEQMMLSGVDACIIKPHKIGQLYIALERFLYQNIYIDTKRSTQTRIQDENKMVLNISKGMTYVRSETFYNEIVAQILLALKNSEHLVRNMIMNDQIEELRTFCVDALGLSATIGATGYVSLLREMLIEMKNEEVFLSQYILRYKESWLELEEEMKHYLSQ